MAAPWGAIIGAGSALAGGLFGGAGEREAERMNLQTRTDGLADFQGGFGALDDAEFGALEDIDYANEILAGVESDVLNQLDEPMRIRIANQVRQNQAQQEAQEQRAAAAGLDATTVGAGLQRSQAYGQAQQIGQLSAAFGGQRASAISSARGNLAQGFMNRAATQQSFGAQRANLFAQQANFRSGFQFQAPNTGAAIGQIGGAIGNIYSQYQSQSNFDKAMGAFNLQGGGGASSPWAGAGSKLFQPNLQDAWGLG